MKNRADNGILYFLTNQAIPGLVKIGYTSGELNNRLRQLNTTSTPLPFLVAATFYVTHAQQCEKEIHSHLSHYRKNPKREFFSAPAHQLISQSMNIIGKYLNASLDYPKYIDKSEPFIPDKDDIYFMFFLLHDACEENRPLSTKQLVEYHLGYAPLELELKLTNLQNNGFIKRISRKHEGLGWWQLLPKGLKFMFDGGHHDQSLIDEARGIVIPHFHSKPKVEVNVLSAPTVV